MTRALVLGGGGPVGIGWESGLAAGLETAGVDVNLADQIVGTSAGSFVGAQLACGLDLEAVVDALSATRAQALAAAADGSAVADRMEQLMAAIMSAALSDAAPEESRRELGRLALEAEVLAEEDFVGFFGVLAGHEWPERFACTAVDAGTGEFVVWRSGSGVPLERGVASSCSVPCVYPPITIGQSRYIDGGMRTGLNADVAEGHDRVLAVSCMALELPAGMSNPMFDAFVGRTLGELERLRSSGSEVAVIQPSAEFLELSGWGTALMDAGKARAAYDIGVRQGAAEAGRVAATWNP